MHSIIENGACLLKFVHAQADFVSVSEASPRVFRPNGFKRGIELEHTEFE